MRPFIALLASAGLALTVASAPVHAAQPPADSKISVDTAQLDTVKTFAKKAQSVANTWYPRIAKILNADTATLPKRITIILELEMDGVAATGGTEIHVSARYVRRHPDDLGMIVHELTHVIQSYPKYDPVWLVEGIADYVRFYHYEPVSQRPRPNPAKAGYHDSYRTTAAFLDWASTRYDRDLVQKLNRALHAGTYTPDLFRQSTGKDLDQLNAEWLASLRSQ